MQASIHRFLKPYDASQGGRIRDRMGCPQPGVAAFAAEARSAPIRKGDHPTGTAAVNQRGKMPRAMGTKRQCPMGANIDRSVQRPLFLAARHAKGSGQLNGRFTWTGIKLARMGKPGEIPMREMSAQIDEANPAFPDPTE